MTMYRIQKDEKRLQPFRSDKFGTKYFEKDLEDWFESNPIVLTDGEPALIIGRQVNTEGGGTIDLLGLDAEGAVLVVELKRAPTPRDVVAQALEYVAWIATLDEKGLRGIGEEYLNSTQPGTSLEEAWAVAFGGEVQDDESGTTSVVPLSDVGVNERQRIFLVVEGRDDRAASIVRYLHSYDLDINLLEYNYYQTEAGEEILDIEVRVGREEVVSRARPTARHTEEALLAKWPTETVKAYEIFRDRIMQEERLLIRPQKTAVSFYKNIRDGKVFVSYFGHSVEMGGYISFRKDSLEQFINIEDTMKHLRNASGPEVLINEGYLGLCLFSIAFRLSFHDI